MIRSDYKWLTDIFVAHRGLFNNKDVPENSVPAFRLAAQKGYGIETDVQATKDGVPVIFHDDTMERMTGAVGRIQNYTYDELKQFRLLDTDCKIPTLADFLAAADNANIIVEIKDHDNIGDLEQKTYRALKCYKGNYCVESFNPMIIRWFKVNAPEVIRGTLSCSYKGSKMSAFRRWLLANLKLCKWNGSQFIAYDVMSVRNNKAVQRFAKKIPIICWTVNSQEKYDEYKDCFDNIIFDSFEPIRYDLEATTDQPSVDE